MQALEIAQAVVSGQIDPQEPTRICLEAVARRNPELHAFLSLNPRALDDAARISQRLGKGESLPLAGVPIAVKDNICIQGMPTTCGSRVLANFVPPYEATVIERLRQAGAIFLGKTNMDEFAMGSSTEHSAFGPTLNPWDLTRVPGGSSGGSAVAVAADLAPLALGSDTGGSVRQPAAYCGVLGFKPTYGRVSRYGLVAYASSLDQIGGFARSGADLAALLDCLAGYDPRDATSLEAGGGFAAALESPAPLRVGVVREAVGTGNSAGVLAALAHFQASMGSLGYQFSEVSLPHLEEALAAYYLVATSEASSNLARYDGTIYGLRAGDGGAVELAAQTRAAGFGPEVKRRIMMGTFALSSGYYDAYYGKALKVRSLLAEDYRRAFEQVDLLLLPTAPGPAFAIGEKTDDPLAMYLMDVDTVSINLAGLPALSFPAGFEAGLPLGLQLVGAPLSDPQILAVAHQFELASRQEFLKVAG
jgi:aspartyl-tRNA(Asn)/glutamyl-tRNA(Gln) amidotransferase subunit A